MSRRPGRRSQAGLVIGGAIVIAAGIAVALVELYALPKFSLWIVVAVAIALIAAVRTLSSGAG